VGPPSGVAALDRLLEFARLPEQEGGLAFVNRLASLQGVPAALRTLADRPQELAAAVREAQAQLASGGGVLQRLTASLMGQLMGTRAKLL
jgi:hypothetical protein